MISSNPGLTRIKTYRIRIRCSLTPGARGLTPEALARAEVRHPEAGCQSLIRVRINPGVTLIRL